MKLSEMVIRLGLYSNYNFEVVVVENCCSLSERKTLVKNPLTFYRYLAHRSYYLLFFTKCYI